MSFGNKEKENTFQEESDSIDEFLDSNHEDEDNYDEDNEIGSSSSSSSSGENCDVEGVVEEDIDHGMDASESGKRIFGDGIEENKAFDCDVWKSADVDEFNVEKSKIKQNPSWADAMAKILKTSKPKRKKTVVLARAKKIKIASNEANDENSETFETEGESDEKPRKIVDSKSDIKYGNKAIAQLEMARSIRKKALEAKGRVKSSVLDKDREKVLAKVATKGVVQLFNAVRQQQKSLEKEIKKFGPSNVKKDKVLKSVDKKAFLDVLMGVKSQIVPQVKDESESKSQWSVLQEDFLMGKKLKNWDKEEDEIKGEIE